MEYGATIGARRLLPDALRYRARVRTRAVAQSRERDAGGDVA